MSDETLLPCPWCGGEAYFDEGENAFDYVIECHHEEGCAVGDWPKKPYDRKSIVVGDLDCCSDDREKAIAAWNTRDYLNPDGLPVGLTLSEDGSLLNWCGENYVKQSTRALTAEQVRNAAHGHYKLRMVLDADGMDAPQVTFDWQAIADELNAELGSGTCDRIAELEAEVERLRRAGYEHGWHDAMAAKEAER